MEKQTIGIASVLIGREFSLIPLLDYFQNVEFPEVDEINLYLVLGCDLDFEILLKNKIEELELRNRYSNIYFIKGFSKCYSDMEWEEWEKFTRQQDPDKKHRAALNNINIALDAVKVENYVHFVDDDTIPPYHALKDLLKSHQTVNNCGLSSGIYFNKEWVEPTIAVCEAEASRRIVGSFQKHKWLNCSIDDLSIENYQDIGFVGNGCMLVSGKDLERILPLTEWREDADDVAPPDFIICRRIRRLGKIISIVPSVLAQHLDQNGRQVGLTSEYLENIKNSTETLNFLITNYTKYLNYEKLSKQFDKILILHHKEIHKKIPIKITDIENIQVIERSISDTCEKYNSIKSYKNINGESMKYAILEEMHDFIKNKSAYTAYYYNSLDNAITKVHLLDNKNLKNLLNKKP
jgi:hypothetical protein